MAPARGSQLCLSWFMVLVTPTWGQVFQPSFILMSGQAASSYFLANTSTAPVFTAVEIDNGGGLPSPSCYGVNRTVDWHLEWTNLQSGNSFEVTLIWSGALCSTNEMVCCTLCVVRTFVVTACQNSTVIASLVIQAEIFSNSTFTGNVFGNATVIPNQAYQPLGPCPCNLTAGACDICCCCDMECSSNIMQLFNGSCYTGVFGGNVTPAYDQLCSVQSTNNAPDWFPFLCVQSPLDNAPFLGYFYQGSTISISQVSSFEIPFPTSPQISAGGYQQGDPILKENNQYFTIPQPMSGHCIRRAPVAFLLNFDVTCVSPLPIENDAAISTLNIMAGNGGMVTLNVIEEQTMDNSNFITLAEAGVGAPTNSCVDVILGANYTFVWETNKLDAVNVTVTLTNICLNQSAILTQRFVAKFVNVNDSLTTRTLSGNPGYQVGKPVLVLNRDSSVGVGTLNLWTTAGRGLCSSAAPTPVLFGEDSTRGCLLDVTFNDNCTQLREDVMTQHLKSFVQVVNVAMRGNSNVTDSREWVQIIPPQLSNTSSNFGSLHGFCLNVPANLNIQIIVANIGAVEGIPQQAILGVKMNFSTVTFNCGDGCTNYSFPISASVQFIRIPAVNPSPLTSFQLNYTEYDCNRNEVCWPQLAYPLTQYYTGESYSEALAKGIVLTFFFMLAAVLGIPWDTIRKAWNNTTF